MKCAKRERSVNGKSKGKGKSPKLYLDDDSESLSELEELVDVRDAADDEYRGKGRKKKYKKMKGLDGKPIRSRVQILSFIVQSLTWVSSLWQSSQTARRGSGYRPRR